MSLGQYFLSSLCDAWLVYVHFIIIFSEQILYIFCLNSNKNTDRNEFIDALINDIYSFIVITYYLYSHCRF